MIEFLLGMEKGIEEIGTEREGASEKSIRGQVISLKIVTMPSTIHSVSLGWKTVLSCKSIPLRKSRAIDPCTH